MEQQNREIEMLFCYAHKDERYLNELKKHLSALRRQELIKIWHDRDINAGGVWDQEIKKHLDEAQFILLLISSDFIDSEYCYGTEMKRALERHVRGEARVIPVILRSTAGWKKVPPGDIQLGQFQALPKNAKPVTNWRKRDEAWQAVVEGIENAVDELLGNMAGKGAQNSTVNQDTQIAQQHNVGTEEPSISSPSQETRSTSQATVQVSLEPPTAANPPLPQQPEPTVDDSQTREILPRHRVPRRLVVIRLAGLVTAVAGSGLGWLALSHRLSLRSGTKEAKWVPTGIMLVGRHSLRATTLMNGMVLVEGGFTTDGLHTDESELFNPRTGVWTRTKRLNETRAEHAATLLLNGNVLVTGGYAGGNITRDSAELYDPRTDRWTVTKKMGRPRTRHTATCLKDGKVLIVGGVSLNGVYLNTAELYDPAANTWSSAGALTTLRADHAAVRLSDGRVLIAGGTLSNDGQTKTSRTEVYDPARNGWTLAQDMIVPRAYFTVVLLPTGNVLAIGGRAEGFNSTAATELYNPIRGSWSMTGDMNSNREIALGQEAVILSDGTVLVVGGDTEGTSEVYSPATGKWTGQSKMGSVRSNSATALLKGGQVLVVGGFDCFCPNPDNTHILASAEIYTSI